MLFVEKEQENRIKRNIWFILSHFKHQTELFPRTIMTTKIGGQKVIEYKTDIQDSINQIYAFCREADFIDCRINAFPFITEYSIDLQVKNRTAANFFIIDLDLKDFDYSNEKLNRTVKRAVKKYLKLFSMIQIPLYYGQVMDIISINHCQVLYWKRKVYSLT